MQRLWLLREPLPEPISQLELEIVHHRDTSARAAILIELRIACRA
jgi:hypothetical protein